MNWTNSTGSPAVYGLRHLGPRRMFTRSCSALYARIAIVLEIGKKKHFENGLLRGRSRRRRNVFITRHYTYVYIYVYVHVSYYYNSAIVFTVFTNPRVFVLRVRTIWTTVASPRLRYATIVVTREIWFRARCIYGVYTSSVPQHRSILEY